MSDLLPENLQVIKIEQPSSPEKANIRERLNLHVKRRLQQDLPLSQSVIKTTDEGCSRVQTTLEAGKKKPKDSPKTRRPYHKRTERIKPEALNAGKKQISAITVTHSASPADLDGLDDAQDLDASQETDGKGNSTMREKEKCPDVLSMVLSMKKNALMNDLAVRDFLAKAIEAIKS